MNKPLLTHTNYARVFGAKKVEEKQAPTLPHHTSPRALKNLKDEWLSSPHTYSKPFRYLFVAKVKQKRNQQKAVGMSRKNFFLKGTPRGGEKSFPTAVCLSEGFKVKKLKPAKKQRRSKTEPQEKAGLSPVIEHAF